MADLSVPQWSAATQQQTAPGSTFKMMVAVAAMEEGAVSSVGETITCTGVFDKIPPDIHRCHIYPGAHGAMNLLQIFASISITFLISGV